MEYTQEQNRALCEAYPFLDRNRRWGAKDCPDGPKPGVPEDLKEWDYEYTELDCMPDGWRIAFGEQLCAELKAELESAGILDQYRILQIKEKYGSLRWYDKKPVISGLISVCLIIALALGLPACSDGNSGQSTAPAGYTLSSVHRVNGRQGICVEGDSYWVSGSTTLTKYDRDWNLVAENTDPFAGYSLEVNHIGDIDVYQNELYLGVEYFMDGVGSNIQVAVYDGDTLELKRVFPFRADTGQLECSGIAVDPDSRTVYMCSWIDDDSSAYLYMYDLDDGAYKGKLRMDPVPKWIQGVAYFDGSLYVTCDDGDADEDAPDHMYRISLSDDRTSGSAVLEKTFDDVTRQGEIEGLSFDRSRGQFLLLYNRGARIVLGMPKGFYEGYTEEIHEVFVYTRK